MSGIVAIDKIRISLLCIGAFWGCLLSSYDASSQQSQEQSPSSAVKQSTTASPSSRPSAETPSIIIIKKKNAPKEGTKKAHPGIPGKKISHIQKNPIHRPHNPIDISTGQELLPMPDEPKR